MNLNPKHGLNCTGLTNYGGKYYRVTTTDHHGTRQAARVKTYGEILREYEFHPESKCSDAEGKRCVKQSIGRLQQRYVQIEQIKYIGKDPTAWKKLTPA